MGNIQNKSKAFVPSIIAVERVSMEALVTGKKLSAECLINLRDGVIALTLI